MAEDTQTGWLLRRYGAQPRRVRWPLLMVIAALHCGAFYLLSHAFAPDMTARLERNVIAAFDVSGPPPAPEPDPPAPPQNRSEPDQGAQGVPAAMAIPASVSAPEARLPLPQSESLPNAASTGSAAQSGAREDGEGTGAAGRGLGTGSGNSGNGRGGVAITRPEHISGAIDNARDYPTPDGGRDARRGTEVVVRVIVGINGRARDCTIYRPSLDPEADRITCELVVSRLGFRPARDANGSPVDAPFYWRQRWF
ncbi:MAG: hypothetical protein AAF559_13290 [Pseudomonadota bacterium]